MRTHVRFTSDLFAAREPEDAQLNAGRGGRALATWLGAALRRRGMPASDPSPEDWGWYLEAAGAGGPCLVGCGSVDGEPARWLVWVDPPRPSLRERLAGGAGAAGARVTELVAAVEACLHAEPAVSAIEWFSADARGHERDHAPHST